MIGGILQFFVGLLSVFGKHQEARARALDRKAGADAVTAQTGKEALDAIRRSEAARDAVDAAVRADPGVLDADDGFKRD
jgi:hypothetical protein